MHPRIKKVEQGKIHLNEEIITDNLFLHPNGFELLEKTPKISKKDLDRMLLHEPEIAIFGTGFSGKVKLDSGVVEAAKKQKLDVHVLKTPEALKKFSELVREGKKVVAHIHVIE
jgi:hypothetical protein